MSSGVEEYQRELKEVKEELKELEEQLQELLGRQSHLVDRKTQLEALLQNHATKLQQKADKQWDRTDFPWSKKLEEMLKSVFKMDSLRPMQLQTMNATMSDRDCLLIMPTGGGKSLCFQLPALLSDGITVVVSPLVSLMEDQVMALEQFGVEAVMLNADADKTVVKNTQDAMTDRRSTLKLIYVTPEKLAKSKRFMNRLEKMYEVGRFARLVIDEVHCCSQWGHDFRPDYKFLGIMKRQFPKVPILGLTATATVKVLEDVKKILNIPSCLLLRSTFNRPNLYYEVKQKPSSQEEVMNDMCQLIKKRFPGQSGIVYCFSQKDSQDVTLELQKRGIRAGCYHANLSAKERSRVHRMWTANQIDIVVATVAFGMGIDKPDVRFVIHHSLSKSMENLYQESGRAGRDGKTSHCILYYRFADVSRQSTMVFTETTGLENLYGIAAYCIDCSSCRRSRIARHFGEVWDSTQCNGMCDHCDPASRLGYTVTKKDVTKLGQDVLLILENASATNQRVTAPKILDAWFGKGTPTLRVKEVKVPAVSRETAERILAHMLLEGFIREDFHFTAYSTICYLVPGSRAKALRSGAAQINMEFETKAKTPSATATTASAPTRDNASKQSSSGSSSSSSPQKAKPVVINKEWSHFSSLVSGPSDSGESGWLSSRTKSEQDNVSKSESVKRNKSGKGSEEKFSGPSSAHRPTMGQKSSSHRARGITSSELSDKTEMDSRPSVSKKRKSGVIYDSDSDSYDNDFTNGDMQEHSKKKQTQDDMDDFADLAFDDSDFDEPKPKKIKKMGKSPESTKLKNGSRKSLSLSKKSKNGDGGGGLSDGSMLAENSEADPICLSDSD